MDHGAEHPTCWARVRHSSRAIPNGDDLRLDLRLDLQRITSRVRTAVPNRDYEAVTIITRQRYLLVCYAAGVIRFQYRYAYGVLFGRTFSNET